MYPFSLPFSHTMRFILLVVCLWATSCYQVRWSSGNFTPINNTFSSGELSDAPVSITAIFKKYPERIISIPVLTLGKAYRYDFPKKDVFFDNKGKHLAFEKVTFELLDKMPQGQVLVNVNFLDKYGSSLTLEKIDLMRIIPSLDTKGNLQYAEYLLEEFSTFGVIFRKEQAEFEITTRTYNTQLEAAVERAYRVDLNNNSLDPTKWEVQILTEDYTDAAQKKASPININQDRILAHSWFNFDKDLYMALLKMKNPDLVEKNLFELPYDVLSQKAEKNQINFDEFRPPLRQKVKSKVKIIGHRKNLRIVPVDLETGAKKIIGLLGRDTALTYRTILDNPISLARFEKEGFYNTKEPRVFRYSYLRDINDVKISINDVPNSDCHVEINLTGKNAQYTFTIGNIDLATLEEQRLHGISCGFNLYPRFRRYNPLQSNIVFDPDLIPTNQRPYFLMTEKASGKWVNNQLKGIEKAYIGYNSFLNNTLDIYLLSYEREMPVWCAQVKLPGAMQEKVRARRGLYNY